MCKVNEEVEDVVIDGKALIYDLEKKEFLTGGNEIFDEEESSKLQNAVLFSRSSFEDHYPDVDLNDPKWLVVPMPQTLLDTLPFTLSDTDPQTPALSSIDNDELMKKMRTDGKHKKYGPKWLMMTDKGFIGRVDTCEYKYGREPVTYDEMPIVNNFDMRFAARSDTELTTITEYIDCYYDHANGYFKALGLRSENDLVQVMIPVTDEQIDNNLTRVADSDLYKGDIYDKKACKIINIEDYRLTHPRIVQLTEEGMMAFNKPYICSESKEDTNDIKLKNEESSFEDAIEQLSEEAKASNGLEQ